LVGVKQQKPLMPIVAQVLEGKILQFPNTQQNHLQALTEILDACREPQPEIQIMCETGMPLRHLHFCLRQLIKQNMLGFHHRKKTYATTEKGLRYLQIWKELSRV
jgi:predicted transcriptional regulator